MQKAVEVTALESKRGIYLINAIVGRGHDPADQATHFALVRFNESAIISLRFGGVMTPPYDSDTMINNHNFA